MQIIENATTSQVEEYLSRNKAYEEVPFPSYKLEVYNAKVGSALISRQFARCVGVLVPGTSMSQMFHISQYVLPTNGADRRDIARIKLEFDQFADYSEAATPIIFGGYKPNIMSLEYNGIITAISKVLGIPVQIVSSPKTKPDEVEDAYWDGKTQTLLLAKRKWFD